MEPELAVSVTFVTDKVNQFFGGLGGKTPLARVRKQAYGDDLLSLRPLSYNDLPAEVTFAQWVVT